MEFQDLYEVLSVPPSASHEQIERAYKRLVSIAHPDLYATDPRACAWANERMKQIIAAYEVLKDATKRTAYDRDRSPRSSPPHATTGQSRTAGTDLIRCPACEGHGRTNCLTCGGAGNRWCPGCHGQLVVTCAVCDGDGRLTARAYQDLLDELSRADSQAKQTANASSKTHGASDPFWQPGYWDRPAPRLELRVAPLLSTLVPGAGQLYNREPQKALTYFGIGTILFFGISLIEGFGVLLFLGFWLYNIYDAHSTGRPR